jgi:hypothetical protein
MRWAALLVFVFGCGGETAIPADAGPAKDTATTDDDAGTPCPPPNLAKGNCIICTVDSGTGSEVHCGM